VVLRPDGPAWAPRRELAYGGLGRNDKIYDDVFKQSGVDPRALIA